MNVYPERGVTPGLARALGRDFPQVLLIMHPVLMRWQLYEIDKGASWDALGLSEAIKYVYRTGDTAPFRQPGFPRVLDDSLPEWPGEWILSYLREHDRWHGDGARHFLSGLEEREERRREASRREVHDMHRAFADDARQFMIDHVNGERRRVTHLISKERDLR